jgi:hypothetical protein
MERLTMTERGSIAHKYRSFILNLKDPEKLALEARATERPHVDLAGPYAFEWILDEMRDRFRKSVDDAASYNVGWVEGGLQRDDQFRSTEKVTRIATALFIEESLKDGIFEKLAAQMAELISRHETGLTTRAKLEGFVYEVISELFAEYARELVLHKPEK